MRKNKLWLVLIPVVLIAIVCIGASGVVMLQEHGEKDYAALISQAQLAAENGDYDAAISAYEKAIEQNDKEIRAYSGLAELYIAMGQPEEAVRLGQRYKDATGDITLENRYDEVVQNMLREKEEQEAETTGDEALTLGEQRENIPTEQLALDPSVLSFISGASYEDYEKAYGTASIDHSSSGSVLHYLSAPFVCSYLSTDGTVRVDETGKPFSTSMPTTVSLMDLSSLLVGMTGSTPLDVLKAEPALSNAAVVSENDGYVVTFTANGCDVRIACDENGTIAGPDAWNEIRISTPVETTGSCILSGYVQDATTGNGIYGAKLLFRMGVGNTSGAVEQEIESGSDGSYSLELDSGDYTVEISGSGYIAEHFLVTVYSWFSSDEMDFTISPELGEEEIRFVLEWGAFPQDLDAYLFGTSSAGSHVRVCYENAYMDGVASFDTDSRLGYGPETITLYDMEGTFQLVVADYNVTGTMAQSGATVKIYMPGETQPTVVPITSSAEDDWLVCTIQAGQLTVENIPYNGQRSPGNKG